VDRREAYGPESRNQVSRGPWPEPPDGFVVRSEGDRALYVAQPLERELHSRGLSAPADWDRLIGAGASVTGRGATAIVPGATGPPWRLKRMRRGGHAGRIWRDRYPSAGRLVATLAASVEVLARGIPTARPVALMVEADARGMVRGAMAFEEIVGSEDLAHRVLSGAVTRDELALAVGAARAMHDRGVVHPDLNLGNILVRGRESAPPGIFVIDFDRASFHDGPVDFAARQAGVRRLERSCAKLTGTPGPLGPGSEDLWYALYAGDDAKLARRFARGRAVGRLALALHRLGWRRRP